MLCSDTPDCTFGFMSVERMELLLNPHQISSVSANIDKRQQITPEMKFTCDGVITKWIIGADWNNGNSNISYPELQIWRNVGNERYKKINGTVIEIRMERMDRLYNYEDTNIPFQAGDILGVFVPSNSQFKILSEEQNSPINYYLSTTSSMQESQYGEIDLQGISSVMTQAYHPLVSIELCELTHKYNIPHIS